MSKRKYPYFGNSQKLPRQKNKLCSCHGNKATRRVDIQLNWFRGDDDVFYVCDVGYALIDANKFYEFYELIHTETERRKNVKTD